VVTSVPTVAGTADNKKELLDEGQPERQADL